MLGLDIGDGCSDCRYYHAHYRLLKRKVHDLKVSYDSLEIGNCFREFLSVCEPGGVIKTRKSGCCCFCFSLRNTKKRGIYCLNNSYAINKFLQGRINARNLIIACIILELVDGTSKALGFY